MKKLASRLKASLVLYVFASLLFLLSIVLDSENLSLLVKPIIIPSIFTFYFIEIKGRINFWFVISLLLFFIGDILYLLDDGIFYKLGLIVFLSPYLIVLYFIFEDFKLLDKKRLITQINLSFVIVFFVLLYIVINVLGVLDSRLNSDFLYFLLFGIELFFMAIFTALLYLAQGSRKNFFLMFAVIAFIVSDLFFIVNKLVYSLLIFKLVNAFAQTVSYYFYVKYMLENSKKNNKKEYD